MTPLPASMKRPTSEGIGGRRPLDPSLSFTFANLLPGHLSSLPFTYSCSYAFASLVALSADATLPGRFGAMAMSLRPRVETTIAGVSAYETAPSTRPPGPKLHDIATLALAPSHFEQRRSLRREHRIALLAPFGLFNMDL
ncbi:hypothetical protein OVY29_04170 [Sphingopyxis sp. SE2]|uniref:hypothetical protein n=1 Tax=Sphingopyxis sp. SE2 TaxID=1586240 RepID=UPI001378315F|nr:hypothetical protein [Sphingopyxis sp. SE2]MDT7527856.1 hypothetical protein [Sphingopyxis sp. SE2]